MDSTVWGIGLEIAKVLLIPLIIAYFGFAINRRLNELAAARDLEREQRQEAQAEKRRIYEEQKQQRSDEMERRPYPHIEFDIDCNFFGPHHGQFAAEFILTADNKGLTRHEFKSIELRLLGIKNNVPFSFWERYQDRLAFPEPVLKAKVIPKNLNFIFVEPGVKQRITFVTILDSDLKYILARAEFHYEEYTPHSTERMFEVPSSNQTVPAAEEGA